MENVWEVEELRALLLARGCGVAGDITDKRRLREMAACLVGEDEFNQIEIEKQYKSPISAFDGVARGLPLARTARALHGNGNGDDGGGDGGGVFKDCFGISWYARDNHKTRMLEWHCVT